MYYTKLEIRTFGLILEFEMSFQQQQHRVAFKHTQYGSITNGNVRAGGDAVICYRTILHVEGPWTEVSSNLIGLTGGFEVVEHFLLKTFFNRSTPSCQFHAVIEVINLLEQLSNIDEIDCQADCRICTFLYVYFTKNWMLYDRTRFHQNYLIF